MTPWKHLTENPPFLVRLMARRSVGGKHVVSMSLAEIAIASGLPLARVSEISASDSWDQVTVGEAARFCAACQFDPLNTLDRNRKAAYFRQCQKQPHQTRFQFLRKSPAWKTELLPLISRLRSLRTSSRLQQAESAQVSLT